MLVLIAGVVSLVLGLRLEKRLALAATLMGQIARYTEAEVVVTCLVGERGREVREFIEECLGEEGLKKSVVVVATRL